MPSRVRAETTQGRGKSSPYVHDDDWCLDLQIAGRAASLRGIADEAHLNAKKIEWRIQCASTLEDAKIEVRTALKSVENVWHTLTSVMMSFSDGMQALLVVPLITFAIAVHALWGVGEATPQKARNRPWTNHDNGRNKGERTCLSWREAAMITLVERIADGWPCERGQVFSMARFQFLGTWESQEDWPSRLSRSEKSCPLRRGIRFQVSRVLPFAASDPIDAGNLAC